MNIDNKNYNALFELFNSIISLTSGNSTFICKDVTQSFRAVVSSYDRYAKECTSNSCYLSHSQLLAACSLGESSPAKASQKDRKRFHRYELSFLSAFPSISYYIREPQSYFAYNLYPNENQVVISPCLFNGVNIVVFYSSKLFIVHRCEYSETTPFITVLSPSIMFKGDTFSLEFIDE